MWPACGRPEGTPAKGVLVDSDRRQLLQCAALVSCASVVGRARVARAVNAESNWSELSASALVERLRRGDLTAESYAQHVLKQCEAKKALNTMISLDPAQVLEGARQADLLRRSGKALGKLHGLLLPVKDSINTHRLPTTSGTGALRDFHPNEDAPIIRQLDGAGRRGAGQDQPHGDVAGLDQQQQDLRRGPQPLRP